MYAQRLIHVGDQRDDLLAHTLAGFDHQFGEKDGVLFVLHEGARAGLDIEHQRVDSFRQLLAHDRGADQVRTLHRAGDVAQRVEFAIGGRDFGSLADHGAAAGFEHAAEIGDRQDSR